MGTNGHNSVNPETGSITYIGPSEITKGNHNNMPARTDAYLPTDERGHIQGSSLGGSNRSDNIVPQAHDVNQGSYKSMEDAERSALRDGCTIQSEKTAFASNQPGNRPDAFMVNDTVTYTDGQTQSIHLSFSNLTNAEQESMNAESSVKAGDMFDAQPNPGDTLRESMSAAEYSELMEETDAVLPNIGDAYQEHIETGIQAENNMEWDFDISMEEISDAAVSTADWDFGDIGPDGGGAESVGPDDGGAEPSIDDD